MVYKSGQIFPPFCHNSRLWQTDGQTDRILITIPRLHYMQRGKKAKPGNDRHWSTDCAIGVQSNALQEAIGRMVSNCMVYWGSCTFETCVVNLWCNHGLIKPLSNCAIEYLFLFSPVKIVKIASVHLYYQRVYDPVLIIVYVSNYCEEL